MFTIIRNPIGMFSLLFVIGFTPININITATAFATDADTSCTTLCTPLQTTIEKKSKFAEWQLAQKGISENAFNYAIRGYQSLSPNLKNKDIITIIDFSKPSSQKRLFVLDLKKGTILFNTLVAHGKNSGKEYATAFSNKAASYQSSLGFYITMDTYIGSHGYSLKLRGCEKGFNDKANDRAIVVHGANYVSDGFVASNGYLGRSHGCPALPENFTKEIIEVIKGGTCLFIYHPTKKYTNTSSLIHG